jgi:hypothetical protein
MMKLTPDVYFGSESFLMKVKTPSESETINESSPNCCENHLVFNPNHLDPRKSSLWKSRKLANLKP